MSSLISIGLTFVVSDKIAQPIVIEFETIVPQDMNFSCYYVTDKNATFCEKNRVDIPVKSGCRNKVKISFLHSELHSFRIDFDPSKSAIKISKISLFGKDVYEHNCETATYRNDINRLWQEGEWTLVSSVGVDPFFCFEGVDIDRGYKAGFNWIYFAIIFLIVLAIFYCLSGNMCKIIEKTGFVNFLFLFLFLFILFTPGFKFDDKEISKEENRTLAAKPQINSSEDILSFGRNFESWFNDHFWCREFFLNLYKKIVRGIDSQDRKIYKEAFVGENGWFFLKNSRGYSNHPVFTESELKNITQFLESVQAWCDKNNIQFYFMVAPDKNKVYGENYKYVKKIRPDSEGCPNQLIKYLHANSNINCIYPAEALKAQKKENEYLYYKNDTHWNYLGAYYGYVELMKQINNQDSISIASIDYFTDYPCVDGDLNRMCDGVQIEPNIRYLLPNFKNNPVAGEEIKHPFTSSLANFIGITKWSSSLGTKKCVVMGDSFSPYLMRYFALSFGEAYNIFNSKYVIEKEMQEYIEDLKPDYFILEIVERYLPVYSEEGRFEMQ